MRSSVHKEIFTHTVPDIVHKLLDCCENNSLELSQEFSLRQGTPRQVFIPATLHERTSILDLQQEC